MSLLKMAEITSGSSFELNNPTEQKLGYVYEFEFLRLKISLRRKPGA